MVWDRWEPPPECPSLESHMRRKFCPLLLLGAPSSPHCRPYCPLGVRGCDGRGCFRALHLDRSAVRPAPQRHGQHIRTRGAPPTATAITVTCSTLASPWLLWPGHRPPLRVQAATRSNRRAQRAALSRHSLANPLVLDVCSKFCPQGQRRAGRARVPTTDRRSSSSTSRRCAVGLASPRSSAVHCCCRARPQLLVRC